VRVGDRVAVSVAELDLDEVAAFPSAITTGCGSMKATTP
jgi:hypothetical protein